MALTAYDLLILCALIFLAAGLYSSVGHAGASGYLAAMALFGLSPAIMKPTALVLNILVAGFATVRLQRAGLINWRFLAPFVLTSVPLAIIGGAVRLPDHWYRVLIGLVLFAGALRLFISNRPVIVFGPAIELGEVLEIMPEISPGLSTELIDYGANGDHYGWRTAAALD